MKKVKWVLSIVLFSFSSLSFAQDFWRKSDFPVSYNHSIMSVDAKNDLVVVSTDLGLAISTDAGENWLSTEISQSCYSVAISKEGFVFALGYDGVMYRSVDSGKTWVDNKDLFYNSKIVCDNDGVLYLCNYLSFYRSTNSGETWTEKNNNGISSAGKSPWNIDVNRNGILIALTDAGLYKSTDKANSWTKISNLSATNIAINSLGYIYADKYSEEPYYYSNILYRSTDNGVTWTELREWYGSFIYINPIDDAIVLADFNYTNNYFISNDYGLNWNTVTFQRSPKFIAYNGSDKYYMGTNDIGIFRSGSLTGPWQSFIKGFPGSFSSVSTLLCHQGVIFAGAKTFGLYHSTDNGGSFNKILPGVPSEYFSVDKLSTTSNGIFICDI